MGRVEGYEGYYQDGGTAQNKQMQKSIEDEKPKVIKKEMEVVL